MVKETFSRNKPGGYSAIPPTVNSFSYEFQVQPTSIDVADLTIVGSSSGTYKVLIFASPPLGAGIMKPKKSLFRLLKSATPVYTPTSISFLSEYQSAFGVPEVGASIFIRLVYVDTDTGQSFFIGQYKGVTIE